MMNLMKRKNKLTDIILATGVFIQLPYKVI